MSAFPAPSETFVVAQIAGLIDRGHDVQIFGRRPRQLGPDPLPARYALRERTHYYRSGLGTLGCAAALLVAGRRFDAVIAHFGPNALLAQRMRELGALQGGLLSVFHGRDASHAVLKHGPGYYAPVFAHSELVLPVSEYFARRLRSLGCPAERMLVHHMGVDVERFAFASRTLEPGAAVELLSVCRLVEKKGMDVAVRAAARVRDQGAAFRFRILGDGPELPKLRALVQQLALEAHVELGGAVSHDAVRQAMAAAHIFVAPSVTAADGDEEGVPVAIMEAAASGLPVVSTLHSGIPELVRHEHTGLLAPERDVEALAQHMLTLIRAPERWSAMGRAGRAHVDSEYNLAKLDARLVELAERAAGQSS